MFENFSVPKELIPSDARFGVGPSLIPSSFLESLLEVSDHLLGTSHRKPAVKSLCKELQASMRSYFKLPKGYEIIMGNGGATFLFDMIGLGLVKKKSLHYVCGEFSHKWYLSHKNIPWIETELSKVDYGKGNILEAKTDADMICCTHNETSTGVMISDFPTVDENTLLVVDATSSAGQLKIDFNKVDVYFFSPQKIFAGEGGFFFAIMSPKALKRADEIEKNKERFIPNIMKWGVAIENSLKHQTYNTPNITGIFYINEQLKILNTLGADKVAELAKKKYEHIKQWVEKKDYLSFYVKEQAFQSHTVATVNVDKKFSVQELADKLRELKIAYDIEGYRKLGENQLRISLFHNVSLKDLEKLTQIISLAIEGEM